MLKVPLLLTLALALLLGGCDRRASLAEDAGTGGTQEGPQPDVAVPDEPAMVQVPPEDGFAVAGHFPQRDDDTIALVTAVTVSFNQPIMAESFSGELVTLSHNGRSVTGVQTLVDETTLEFRPDQLLAPDTTYEAAVVGEAMSQSGLELQAHSWSFRTVADVYTTSQEVIDQCMSAMDVEMLAAVNQARATSRNCGSEMFAATGKLSWDCNLQVAAIKHAQDMSTNNFFSHTGSDGSSIGDRALRAGYRYSYAAENLAAGQRNLSSAMTGLLESPGHCRNIMSSRYVHFGSGYSTNENSDHRRYWAQAFARPR